MYVCMYVCMQVAAIVYYLCKYGRKYVCTTTYLVNGRGSPVSRPVPEGGVDAAVDVRQADVMEVDMKRWIQRLHNALRNPISVCMCACFLGSWSLSSCHGSAYGIYVLLHRFDGDHGEAQGGHVYCAGAFRIVDHIHFIDILIKHLHTNYFES